MAASQVALDEVPFGGSFLEGFVFSRGLGSALTTNSEIRTIGGNTTRPLMKLVKISCVVKDIGPMLKVLEVPLDESWVPYLKGS